MRRITTFLTFNDQAREAVALYTSVFRKSRIVSETPPGGPFYSATFELEGETFIALNGGPSFSFAQGVSLFVNCETQAEVDELWSKLSAGGEEQPCGWLKDRFGLSWQIIPSVLGGMLGHRDREKAGRAMQAMLQMKKLDIARLQAAFDGR